MWLFTQTGFVSIVAKPGDLEANTRTVRSRDSLSLEIMREDIYRLFNYELGEIEIVTTENSDYRHRMVVAKSELDAYLTHLSDGITYDNFKNEAVETRPELKDTYYKVWLAGLGLSDG